MFLKLFLFLIFCFKEPARVSCQFGASEQFGPMQASGGFGPQGGDASIGFDAPVNPYDSEPMPPPQALPPVASNNAEPDVGPSAGLPQSPSNPAAAPAADPSQPVTTPNSTDLLHQPDVGDAGGCSNPNAEIMTIPEMCSMPPEKGFGSEDILRIYYNPTVGMCLPFSYMGFGGNYNRFVSMKNCYEICNPAVATVKKPRVVAGIKTYIIPKPKSTCAEQDELSNQVIQSPAEPFISGDASIMPGPPGTVIISDGTGTTRIVPTQVPKVKLIQRMFYNDYYYPQQQQGFAQNPGYNSFYFLK